MVVSRPSSGKLLSSWIILQHLDHSGETRLHSFYHLAAPSALTPWSWSPRLRRSRRRNRRYRV